MKKVKIVVASLAICAAVFVGYNTYSNLQTTSNLMLENVEAMAAGESFTSWNCRGGIKTCGAGCGICGTQVLGSGRLTGTHRCN